MGFFGRKLRFIENYALSQDGLNIGMFSLPGLEHNFEKYTVGEVETLPVNKDFYDYDVSTNHLVVLLGFLPYLLIKRIAC